MPSEHEGHEPSRLAALQSYRILDTLPERALDELTELAAELCQTPVALISLIDERRQWFKSKFGIGFDETPREFSFCTHSLGLSDLLIISDTTEDERFRENPYVTGNPGFRFYAGAQLTTPNGEDLGTLCVLDCKPRQLSESQVRTLKVLSSQVMAHLELHRQTLELREKEARLRSVIESSIDAIVEMDHQGSITAFNPAAEHLFGYRKRDVLGQPLADILIPEHLREAHRTALGEHLITGRSTLLNRRISTTGLSSRGVEIPLELTVTRLKSIDPPRFSGILRDISERLRQERELKESESRLLNIFHSSPVGVIVHQVSDWVLVEMNRAFTKITGWSREDAVKRSLVDLNILERGVARRLQDHLERGESLRELEVSLRTRGGATRHVLVGTEFVHLKGEPHVITTFVDITERTNVQARLSHLVESNVQGVVFWGPDGEILRTNEQFVRLLGYEPLGSRLGSLCAPRHQRVLEEAWGELHHGNVSKPFELELTHRNGIDSIPVLMGLSSFADSPREGVAFVIDLSERKALEQQFVRAQRMESIVKLAAGVSHDLNNSLGPMVLGLDLLATLELPEQAESLLKSLQLDVQRGVEIARRLQSLASGGETEKQNFCVRHMLEEVEELLKTTLPKSIHVKTAFNALKEESLYYFGDAPLIRQMLINLCHNARDAMPRGGELLLGAEKLELDEQFLSAEPLAHQESYLLLTVEDNGVGIDRDFLDKIFEPFFTTKKGKATDGLGLSSAAAIVRSHDGFIKVRTSPGCGSRFEVYLPMPRSENMVSLLGDADSALTGNNQLILVVDDDATVRRVTRQTLESHGYRVVVAEDGVDGLAKFTLSMDEIALVLVDLVMPEMDGFTAVGILRALCPALPIIAVSARHQDESRELDVSYLLKKPFTAEVLLGTIRKALVQG